MDKLVFPNELEFLRGCLMVDGVVDVTELVVIAKETKKSLSLRCVSKRSMTLLVGSSWTIRLSYLVSLFSGNLGFRSMCF